MNYDMPPQSPEKEPYIPSLEAIKSEIERLTGKENLEVVRTLEDEKGVYVFEVVSVDEKGDATTYSFQRGGNYPASGEYPIMDFRNTVITVDFYRGSLKEGMPMGGHNLSDYDEALGRWVDVK